MQVQIDYDKFAELAGLTVGSARVIWGKIRRKLAAAGGIDGTPASAASQAAKSKVKKGGRKRNAEDTDNTCGDAIGEPQSPTTMAAERRKKRVKKSAKTEAPAEQSEEEGCQIKAEDGVVVKTEQ